MSNEDFFYQLKDPIIIVQDRKSVGISIHKRKKGSKTRAHKFEREEKKNKQTDKNEMRRRMDIEVKEERRWDPTFLGGYC